MGSLAKIYYCTHFPQVHGKQLVQHQAQHPLSPFTFIMHESWTEPGYLASRSIILCWLPRKLINLFGNWEAHRVSNASVMTTYRTLLRRFQVITTAELPFTRPHWCCTTQLECGWLSVLCITLCNKIFNIVTLRIYSYNAASILVFRS